MAKDNKTFKFKVLYDKKTKVLQGIPVKDVYGNTVGSSIVVSDDSGKLPNHSNKHLLTCDAELVIQIPRKKIKGERIFRKISKNGVG